jgi:hypothetical protein
MDVSGSKIGGKTVAITGKAEEGMEAVLAKMTVLGHSLLLTLHRVLGRIQVENQPLFVIPSQRLLT